MSYIFVTFCKPRRGLSIRGTRSSRRELINLILCIHMYYLTKCMLSYEMNLVSQVSKIFYTSPKESFYFRKLNFSQTHHILFRVRMHKNNLGLETDCTWGVPIVETVSRSEPVVEKKKPKYHSKPCLVRDPVSLENLAICQHVTSS